MTRLAKVIDVAGASQCRDAASPAVREPISPILPHDGKLKRLVRCFAGFLLSTSGARIFLALYSSMQVSHTATPSRSEDAIYLVR